MKAFRCQFMLVLLCAVIQAEAQSGSRSLIFRPMSDARNPMLQNPELSDAGGGSLNDSPYLLEQFLPGLIVTRSDSFSVEKMNVDIMVHQLVVNNSGQLMIVDQKEVRQFFALDKPQKRKYIFRELDGEQKIFQLLGEGELSLLKLSEKRLQRATEANGYTTSSKPETIVSAKPQYFISKDNYLLELPLSKKELDLLSISSNKWKKLLSANDLNRKITRDEQEKDWVMMINELNK